MTGIGGQGVQLAARTLAVAAVHQGLEVMVFGSYAGVMRGGSTDATVVLADGPLRSPPTVAHAWAALAMHHEYWPGVASRLVAGGIAVIDRSVFQGDAVLPGVTTVEVEATAIAADLGNSRGGAMVALGALAGVTGIVGLGHLEEAALGVLPSYRAGHARANVDALRAGFGRFTPPTVPAWPAEARI